MEIIKEKLPKIVLEHISLTKELSANKYKMAFEELFQEYKDIFSRIEEKYQEASNKQEFLQEIADDFVKQVKTQFDATVKKSNKETLTLDYNMIMTSFAIPCMLEYHRDSTDELVDYLVQKWNATFTRYKIQKGRFSDIDGSFKRKLCYITTAVCDSMNKEDDCYELTLLRKFRDQYMLQTEEGQKLVKEYYEIAPQMVMRISLLNDAEIVYRTIYERYIKPCIECIEKKQFENCQNKYIEMVNELKGKLIGGHHE